MNITVIGTGYVGLVTGVCLADFGHVVTCVDSDAKKVLDLQKGQVPIFEPGLDELINKNAALEKLYFSNDLFGSVSSADAIFIAVGTPINKDGTADLRDVYTVINDLALCLKNYSVIVIKSTVPIGTNNHIKSHLENNHPNLKFDIVSNPEFLREGAALSDFMYPDRLVVGSDSDKAKTVMAEIYKPIIDDDVSVLYTDLESAEMIKYASNAFLAIKVSFINEIANLCEKVDANIDLVSMGMGMDSRIGNKFLQTGPGFGGSCFPKDTSALIMKGKDVGATQFITEAAIISNELVKERMAQKIIDGLGGSVSKKIITILGITFKANTDDLRSAPSLVIIPLLLECGALIRVVDNYGQKSGTKLLPEVDWFEDPYKAVTGADCVVTLTEWDLFKNLNLRKLAKLMRTSVFVDLRNLYSKADVVNAGFERYAAIGRN